MEHAPDLLFDFEEAKPSGCLCVETLSLKNDGLEALARRVELAASRNPSRLARQLHRDVTTLLGRLCPGFLKPSDALFLLAAGLQGLGYAVSVRTALGGGTRECFKSLRHEFLVVRGTGEFRGMEFIVEPSLRQHFLIPHPSREYEYVLSRTPDVFVGGSCRLVPVVQLLCALMADSFQRQGLPLPPWRKEAAMMSKWLPNPSSVLDRSLCNASHVAEMNPASSPIAAQAPKPRGTTQTGLTVLQTLSGDWASKVPTNAAQGLCPQTAVVIGFDVSHPRPVPAENPQQQLPSSSEEETCGDSAGQVNGRGRYGGSGLCLGSGRNRPRSSSFSCIIAGRRGGGDDCEVVLMPYMDLDECASPCRGHSAGDDTNSFLLGSEISAVSAVQLYGTPSLMGSPLRAGAAAPALDDFFGADAASPLSSRAGRRRATGTGMLPCAFRGTGLLAAQLVLEPLAASAAAQPSPPAPPQGLDDVPASPAALRSPSPVCPCPFTLVAGAPCLERRPPAHADAPAIDVVRLAGALAGRDRSACSGRVQGPAATQAAEWLSWGGPH